MCSNPLNSRKCWTPTTTRLLHSRSNFRAFYPNVSIDIVIETIFLNKAPRGFIPQIKSLVVSYTITYTHKLNDGCILHLTILIFVEDKMMKLRWACESLLRSRNRERMAMYTWVLSTIIQTHFGVFDNPTFTYYWKLWIHVIAICSDICKQAHYNVNIGSTLRRAYLEYVFCYFWYSPPVKYISVFCYFMHSHSPPLVKYITVPHFQYLIGRILFQCMTIRGINTSLVFDP